MVLERRFLGDLGFLGVILGGIVEFWKVLGCSAWFLMIWEVGEWFCRVLDGLGWFWAEVLSGSGRCWVVFWEPKLIPKGPN